MKRLKFIIISLICVLSGTQVQGADEIFQFTHINTSNSDISYDGISKIMQEIA